MLLLGTCCAVVPTFLSWLVGLYILKMDPMVLAGAVSGARNSTTAMRAISDKSKSTIPSFGYPVPYALSTVVFLIYGYVAMLLSEASRGAIAAAIESRTKPGVFPDRSLLVTGIDQRRRADLALRSLRELDALNPC